MSLNSTFWMLSRLYDFIIVADFDALKCQKPIEFIRKRTFKIWFGFVMYRPIFSDSAWNQLQFASSIECRLHYHVMILSHVTVWADHETHFTDHVHVSLIYKGRPFHPFLKHFDDCTRLWTIMFVHLCA